MNTSKIQPPAAGEAAHTLPLTKELEQQKLLADLKQVELEELQEEYDKQGASHAALVALATDAASVDGSEFARAMQQLYDVASASEATADELREAAINACSAGQAQMEQARAALAAAKEAQT